MCSKLLLVLKQRVVTATSRCLAWVGVLGCKISLVLVLEEVMLDPEGAQAHPCDLCGVLRG